MSPKIFLQKSNHLALRGKNIVTLFFLILCLTTALAQDPIITMTTEKKVGYTFSFTLKANVDTKVKVDFGNGTQQEFTVVSADKTLISEKLTGSTVKVYGSGAEITYLICLGQEVTVLDVTKASALYFLNCNDNLLTTLDISKNTNLAYLECNRNQLANLEAIGNTALVSLDCSSNLITTLNVPNNPDLSLDCRNNQLFTLTVPKIKNLICKNNKLTFATLPLKQANWTDLSNPYIYAPQQPVFVGKSISIEDEIDLSAQLHIDGKTTAYTWKTENDDDLVEGTDYVITQGITIFKKPQADSVYCEMYNETFPSFVGLNALTTNMVKIKKPISGPPIITMTTAKIIGNYTYIILRIKAGVETNVEIDFGDGIRKDYNVKSTDFNTIIEQILGSTIKIYGIASDITYFDCSNDSLTTIDLTNATALKQLQCNDNLLTKLEISNNTKLEYLFCNDNQLTSIDISKNGNLSFIQCKNNRFTFASLPTVSILSVLIYAPQLPIPIAKDFNTGSMIDLSSHFSARGISSVYTWKTKSGTRLTEGIDYTITSGKTVFMKSQADSVYCEMTNSSFPDFKDSNVLRTNNTKISGEDVSLITMTTLQAKGSPFSIILCANTNNTSVQVDFGDGTLIGQTIGTEDTQISGSLIGSQTVKIYGSKINYLNCINNQLSALDVTKNTALVGLDCYNNKLATLDISKNNALEYLNCGNNQLSTLDVTNNTALTSLYFDHNRLTTIIVSGNTNLIALSCSYNLLSTIDVTRNTKLASFTCNNNLLSDLDVSLNTALFQLTCNNNRLTYSNLPVRSMQEYRYAPQQRIPVAKNFSLTDILDLSNQLSIDGKNTAYTLKTKGGLTLIKGTDYNITDGRINFIKAQTDSVYCEMTNASFPYFNGIDALKTTCTKVSTISGINETEGNQFLIYPNPTTGILYIKGEEIENANILIYNLAGTQVWSDVVKQQSINIPELPAGNYILTIIGSGKRDRITRFVKQ